MSFCAGSYSSHVLIGACQSCARVHRVRDIKFACAQLERVAQTEAVGLDLPEFYRARAPDPGRSLTVRSSTNVSGTP